MTHPRPGVPAHFSATQLAKLLRVSKETIYRHLKHGTLRGRRVKAGTPGRLPGGRTGYVWRFPRREVARFMRANGFDPAPLRDACRPADGRVFVVTADPALFVPGSVLLDDLFDLGRHVASLPTAAVVFDFDHCGRDWSYKAAGRLAREEGHPLLVAVEDDEAGRPRKRRGVFDLFLTRQAARDRLGLTVTQMVAGCAPAPRGKRK